MLKKILVIPLSLQLLCSASHAINPADLLGVEDILAEGQERFSPAIAQAALSSKWLARYRFAGPFCGDDSEDTQQPYDQLKATRTDKPQSPTARLFQFLFPSPGGVTFVPNNREYFPLNTLAPGQLGTLFFDALSDMTADAFNIKFRGMLDKSIRRRTKDLSPLMLQAFREGEEVDRLIAQHNYIAFSLTRCSTKAQLLDFMTAAGLVKKGAFDEEGSKAAWLSRRYTEKDYRAVAGASLDEIPEGQTEYAARGIDITALSSPEELVLLGTAAKRYEKIDLEVPYATAYFGKESFSNCSEAALFSLVNRLLFNEETNTLDLSRLPQTTLPTFKAFFEGTVGQQDTLQSFLPEWSVLVSNLPDDRILYREGNAEKGRYNIISTLGNLVTILEHIFGLQVDRAQSVVDRWTSFVARFNQGDNHKFDIEAVEGERTSLELTLNDNTCLTINSSGTHTSLEFQHRYSLWTHDAAVHMLGSLLESQEARLRPESAFVFALFGNEELFKALVSRIQKEQAVPYGYREILAGTYPLQNTNGKLRFIDFLMKSGQEDLLERYRGAMMRFNYSDGDTLLSLATILANSDPESLVARSIGVELMTVASSNLLAGLAFSFFREGTGFDEVFDQNFSAETLDLSSPLTEAVFELVVPALVTGELPQAYSNVNVQELAADEESGDEGQVEARMEPDGEVRPQYRVLLEALQSKYEAGSYEEKRKVASLYATGAEGLLKEGLVRHGYEMLQLAASCEEITDQLGWAVYAFFNAGGYGFLPIEGNAILNRFMSHVLQTGEDFDMFIGALDKIFDAEDQGEHVQQFILSLIENYPQILGQKPEGYSSMMYYLFVRSKPSVALCILNKLDSQYVDELLSDDKAKAFIFHLFHEDSLGPDEKALIVDFVCDHFEAYQELLEKSAYFVFIPQIHALLVEKLGVVRPHLFITRDVATDILYGGQGDESFKISRKVHIRFAKAHRQEFEKHLEDWEKEKFYQILSGQED